MSCFWRAMTLFICYFQPLHDVKTPWLCSPINHSGSSWDYLCYFFIYYIFLLKSPVSSKNKMQIQADKEGRVLKVNMFPQLVLHQDSKCRRFFYKSAQRHLNASSPSILWLGFPPLTKGLMCSVPPTHNNDPLAIRLLWWSLKCRAIR